MDIISSHIYILSLQRESIFYCIFHTYFSFLFLLDSNQFLFYLVPKKSFTYDYNRIHKIQHMFKHFIFLNTSDHCLIQFCFKHRYGLFFLHLKVIPMKPLNFFRILFFHNFFLKVNLIRCVHFIHLDYFLYNKVLCAIEMIFYTFFYSFFYLKFFLNTNYFLPEFFKF